MYTHAPVVDRGVTWLQEIIILIIAIVWKGNKLSPLNGLGLVVCLLGITVHVIFKAVEGTYAGRLSARHHRARHLQGNRGCAWIFFNIGYLQSLNIIISALHERIAIV